MQRLKAFGLRLSAVLRKTIQNSEEETKKITLFTVVQNGMSEVETVLDVILLK